MDNGIGSLRRHSTYSPGSSATGGENPSQTNSSRTAAAPRSRPSSMPAALDTLSTLTARPRPGTADLDATPATPRGTHVAEAREAAPVDEATPGLRQLHTLVAGYFAPHRKNGNDAMIDRLVENRARQLGEMGETAESVAAVFTKASRMDALARTASGFLGSVPFGAATLVEDAAPVLTAFAKTPFENGTMGGVVSHVFDAAGERLLRNALSDTQWLSAPADPLAGHPAAADDTDTDTDADAERAALMQDMKTNSAPSPLRTHVEAGVAIQTFSLRNLARTATDVALTHFRGAPLAARVDLWMSAVGSPVAGGAYALTRHQLDQQHHRVGPEYLLARADWREQYRSLKQATWSGAAANGLGRLARIPLDVATSATSAAQSLLDPANLAKGAVLGGGFGAVSAAVSAAADLAAKHGLSQTATAAIRQGVQTATSAAVFPAWTSAAISADGLAKQAGAAVDAVGGALGGGVSSVANAVLTGVGHTGGTAAQTLHSVPGALGNALDTVVNGASDAVTSLRRRAAPQRGTSLSAAENAV